MEGTKVVIVRSSQSIDNSAGAWDVIRLGFRLILAVSVLPLLFVGCKPAEGPSIQRHPRPVAVGVLRQKLPPNPALVTASAGSRKTEDLGFEVGGRVEFVADQNTEIDGRIPDADGKLIIEGTPIARIESERYELAVASEKAAVARSEQDLKVAQTEL